MATSTMRYATILALSTAVISGTNNFLTKIAVTSVKDPIVFTTLKNALVAVFIVGVILAFKKWKEISSLTRIRILKLSAIGIIGGSLPFILYFTGLTQTSALNAGLIHKTLFLWVALLAIPLLKERMTILQWAGIIAIFSANLVIGGFSGFKFNSGELMILTATLLWAVENIIAKVALRDISSVTVAAARMIFGSLLLIAVALWRGNGSVATNLSFEQWSWIILTSALLAGYVLCWYTALKYAPATYVATLLVPATLITNVLSTIFITRTFSFELLISAFLFITGTALVIAFAQEFIQNRIRQNALRPATAR